MKKSILTSLIVIGLLMITTVSTIAETSKKTSDMIVYSSVLVSPLNYDVKTGDLVNLKISNRSNQNITFRIPIMNIDVEVNKNSNKVVPVNFENPKEKSITFFVTLAPGNSKTGSFKVTDYQVKQYSSNVEAIDTTALSSIINYKKTDSEWEARYSITPKEEPVSISVEEKESIEVEQTTQQPEPAKEQTGGFVRGFW